MIKASYVRKVEGITFSNWELNSLVDVCTAANRWIESSTTNGIALAAITETEISNMKKVIERVFEAFSVQPIETEEI